MHWIFKKTFTIERWLSYLHMPMWLERIVIGYFDEEDKDGVAKPHGCLYCFRMWLARKYGF